MDAKILDWVLRESMVEILLDLGVLSHLEGKEGNTSASITERYGYMRVFKPLERRRQPSRSQPQRILLKVHFPETSLTFYTSTTHHICATYPPNLPAWCRGRAVGTLRYRQGLHQREGLHC